MKKESKKEREKERVEGKKRERRGRKEGEGEREKEREKREGFSKLFGCRVGLLGRVFQLLQLLKERKKEREY